MVVPNAFVRCNEYFQCTEQLRVEVDIRIVRMQAYFRMDFPDGRPTVQFPVSRGGADFFYKNKNKMFVRGFRHVVNKEVNHDFVLNFDPPLGSVQFGELLDRLAEGKFIDIQDVMNARKKE